MIHTQDADFTLYQGDVLEQLGELADESVHCIVTSPPYWGLRDYGVDDQLGLEPTPDAYVQRMVEVFREVRRVMRQDATLWLNLGDSYISGQGGRQSAAGELPSTSRFDRPDPKPRPDLPNPPSGWAERAVTRRTYPGADSGWKPKDLAGMPWRVAFALQADGWYLRSDIIWAKPNPMPESVTDRPTKAHEYVFLLAKSPRYFFDQEAVREKAEWARWGDQTSPKYRNGFRGEGDGPSAYVNQTPGQDNSVMPAGRWVPDKTKEELQAMAAVGRNVRSVWEIATQPYPEAHFATYPEELVRRCILAGTSERGCCPECGKPWEREVIATGADNGRVREDVGDWIKHKGGNADGKRSLSGATYQRQREATDQWQTRCACVRGASDQRGNTSAGTPSFGSAAAALVAPPDAIPCTVLDPFLGSGTTAYVARQHGRRSIGIELNAEYCDLAARRMQQQSLFAELA